MKDRTGRSHKFRGDMAHRFHYLLADLLWNLTILFNIQAGWQPTALNREELWSGLVGNRRNLDRIAEANGKIVPKHNGDTRAKSRNGGPPTYAPFLDDSQRFVLAS